MPRVLVQWKQKSAAVLVEPGFDQGRSLRCDLNVRKNLELVVGLLQELPLAPEITDAQ